MNRAKVSWGELFLWRKTWPSSTLRYSQCHFRLWFYSTCRPTLQNARCTRTFIWAHQRKPPLSIVLVNRGVVFKWRVGEKSHNFLSRSSYNDKASRCNTGVYRFSAERSVTKLKRKLRALKSEICCHNMHVLYKNKIHWYHSPSVRRNDQGEN